MKYWFKRKVKWPIQRFFRGYSDCDVWNMNDRIGEVVAPLLKAYRNSPKCGFPIKEWNDEDVNASVSFTEDEWNAIVDDMIFAFEYMANSYFPPDDVLLAHDVGYKIYQEYNERYEKGIKLFAEYAGALWD